MNNLIEVYYTGNLKYDLPALVLSNLVTLELRTVWKYISIYQNYRDIYPDNSIRYQEILRVHTSPDGPFTLHDACSYTIYKNDDIKIRYNAHLDGQLRGLQKAITNKYGSAGVTVTLIV